MQYNEDIYKTVNNMIRVLKEGQLYSNEISKYMSNYFENAKKINRNQKQLIKVVNQDYKSEKFKKIIESNQNKNIKKEKGVEYNTNRIRIINHTNIQNIINQRPRPVSELEW